MRRQPRRLAGVTFLGLLQFFFALAWMITSVSSPNFLAAAVGLGFLVLGLGLMQLRPWGRTVTIWLASIAFVAHVLAIAAWATGNVPDDDGNPFQKLMYASLLLLDLPYWTSLLLAVRWSAELLRPQMPFGLSGFLPIMLTLIGVGNGCIVWYLSRRGVKVAFGKVGAVADDD